MINILNGDWINLTFILIFVLLVLNKLLFQKRFVILTTKIFSNKYFSMYLKDSPLITSTFNIIFFPINLLIISLTLFFISTEYYKELIDNYNFTTFLYFVLIIFIFFVLKIILRFIINIILSTIKRAKQFSFFKLSFRSLSSLVILPFLLIHQYSVLDKDISLTLLVSVFITLLAIQYLYSSYLIIAQKQYSLFYIILYLCTLEIIPAIIYIKLIFILKINDFISF